MIKLKYLLLICCLFSFMACDDLEVATPGVKITPASSSAKAGEPIKFAIDGYADMIAFYSGEPRNEYAHKDGRVIDVSGSTDSLTFSTALAVEGKQIPELTLLASTDFDGNYASLASVKSATWVDITDRFKYGTNATFVSSTKQSVTDLVIPGKPIYFAFRYVTKSQEVNGLVRNWQIQSFALSSGVKFNGAYLTIVDQANAGFRIIDEEPDNAPARSIITPTRVSLLGNVYNDPTDPKFDPENPIYDPTNPIYDPSSPLYDANVSRPEFVPYDPNSPWNDPELEHWAVTKPIYINEVDLGPDPSQVIKGIANAEIEEFQYTYSAPGTYTAHFVVINASIEGRKEVVKEFTITVTE